MNYLRTRIKMCGMTRPDDIAYAVHLGVDAIGLIFYPLSARYIDLEQAKMLLQELPAFVDIVAVLVNPEEALVRQILSELPIQYLQFHGEESPFFCESFKKPYIKAVPASSNDVILKAVESYKSASALLLETPSTLNWGGSGVVFDWRVIPKEIAKPIILAGGLNSENVVAAIDVCSPYAVDVCSGIERSLGVKHHDKMRQFVNTVWVKK